MLSGKSALFPGYKATIADLPSKQRYEEKLEMIEGQDFYAVLQCQSLGWKILTSGKVQATFRLVCTCHFFLSPNKGDDVLNYMILECYQRFVAGWMRDVLVNVMQVPVVCLLLCQMPLYQLLMRKILFICYCQGPQNGAMIACDNSSCPNGWFHFECSKVAASPQKKTWYCPDCSKVPRFKRRKL